MRRYLFSDWDRFFFKIQKSPRIFLFFDYDGTLTPIVSTPSKAKFPSTAKSLIKRLTKHPRFTAAIISGRSLKDIKKMAGIKNIIYAGNHGMEIEGKGIKFLGPFGKKSSPLIKKIGRVLRREFKHIKGAKVEDKGITLSVHYRLVKPKDKSLIKERFNDILRPYVCAKELRVVSGKEVLEARPGLGWDKGKAVSWLLRGKKNTLPVYIGDDVTDIDAFRVIRGRGISIFVGCPEEGISADYFLNNPKDVERFIEKLLEL